MSTKTEMRARKLVFGSWLRKLRFGMYRNGVKRANYLREKDILRSIGTDVYFHSRIFPTEPKLLKLGNNVVIATDVRFLTHDRIDLLLRKYLNKTQPHYLGCIQVDDNVFLGANVIVCPDVHIGSNTIVGAGAVVTKDLPSGYVWGGVPARQISTFDEFVAKRKRKKGEPFTGAWLKMPEEKKNKTADRLWKAFEEERNLTESETAQEEDAQENSAS